MDKEDYGKVHEFQPYIPSCYTIKSDTIWEQDNKLYKMVGLKRYIWHDGGYWIDCPG